MARRKRAIRYIDEVVTGKQFYSLCEMSKYYAPIFASNGSIFCLILMIR